MVNLRQTQVFLSFTGADMQIKNELVRYIASFAGSDLAVSFGEEKMWALDPKRQQEMILMAEIVVVLVSQNYLNTKEIAAEQLPFILESTRTRRRLLAVGVDVAGWNESKITLPLFTSLQSLAVTDKNIAYAQILAALTSMSELLQNNHAYSIIEEEKKSKTGQLVLDDRGLRQIPFDILEMDWLEYLSLSHNYIESIEHLKNTTKLISLDLAYNHLTEIKGLGRLTELRELHLNNNSIKKLNNGLGALYKLERLELHHNSLTEITPLADITTLKVVGVSNNYIKSLNGIQNLTNLSILYAAHNQLDDIEPLKTLPLLQRIVLTDNKIRSIKPLLSLIEAGLKVAYEYSFKEDEQGIYIKDNTSLNEPSIEVIQSGRDAVLKYFRDADKYQVRKLEIVKVILVGNSRVGKTNLSQFLRKKKVNLESNSTHLLDIQGWDAPFLVSTEGKLTHVKIFDFGGQDYYHDAHRMFYSHDTAYLLLWDTVTNNYAERPDIHPKTKEKILYENFPLEYWLESINYNIESKNLPFYKTDDGMLVEKAKGKSVPVLIIQNKIDVEEGKLDQKYLVAKYPNVWGFFNVSLSTSKRTSILYEVLSDYFHALDLTGRKLIRFELNVVNHFLNKSEPLRIITIEAFRQECIDIIYEANPELKDDPNFIFNTDNAIILAQILNNTGVFLFEKIQDTEGLVYTNVAQLNLVLKEVMEAARAGNDKGIFSRQQVKNIAHRDAAIELLLRNNSIIKVNDNEFLAPQFLPITADPSIQFFLHSFSHVQMRFVYRAYFHKTLLLNLFSKYLQREHIDSSLGVKRFPFWRNGIIIKRAEDEGGAIETVLVEFEKNADMGIVKIRTMHPFNKNGLEREIEQTLDELNKGWSVEKQVSVDSKHFFSVEYLKTESENKQYTFTHMPSVFNTEQTTWEKWQAFIQSTNPATSTSTTTPLPFIARKNFSINDFKHIVDFSKLPKKLFISYSSKNSAFIRRFITHLDVLRSNGLIDPWYDRMIEPGTKWDDVIRGEMQKSDMVIFLLSPDFLATEYVMKEEIPLAHSLFGNSGKFFFVQLLPCSWEKTIIFQFQQTGNAAETNKNIISIDSPDNDGKWKEVVDVLEAKLKK